MKLDQCVATVQREQHTMKPFFLFLSAFAVIQLTQGKSIETIPDILRSGNSQLTARLFSEVTKNNEGRSVVLSAYSLLTPLAQLALAAEGRTHDEILNAIGFPDNSTIIDDVFTLMHEKTKNIKGVLVKTVSQIYIATGYEAQDVFATTSKYLYHSPISNIDFTDNENAAKEINDWVEEETNHRIKELIDPSTLGYDTRAVLVNALYFKGDWKYPFTKVGGRNFYITNEETIQVPTMQKFEKYGYRESNRLKSKILEIPYVGDKNTLLLVLPDDVEGIQELLAKLKDPNILDDESKDLFYTDVFVRIPKFKIETRTDLKDVLQHINIREMFSDNAYFPKLLKSGEPIKVTNAVQKAFIVIDEKGTEAAAANDFGAKLVLANVGPAYEFIADHPFVFFLRANDDIIFNGVFYGS